MLSSDIPSRISRFGIGLALIFLFGCATTNNRMISQAMRAGNWEQAIRLLTAESIINPDNARTWARLGEAQYHAGQDEDARISMNKALSIDPTLASCHLFLGYLAERRGELPRALWHYQVYADRNPGSDEAREAVRRIEALRHSEAERFALEAIANERSLAPVDIPDSTIGVVYFRSERLPENLRPLAKGLAEMTVTDLSKVRSLRVVERLKTEKILEELKLANSTAFDSSSAPRFGKLLGASHVLGGEIAELTSLRLRMDPVIVSAKSGEATVAKDQTGALGEFFDLQKRMVFDVLDKMGIRLTEAERDSIGRVPTESVEAFLAWSRGLEQQDRGHFEAAREEFRRAVSLDPSFHEAQTGFERMQDLAGADTEPASLETFAAHTSEQPEWSEPPPATDERLASLLDNTGLIRLSPEAPAEGDEPVTPPATGASSVIIHGRFDD